MEQLPLAIRLRERAVFDGFVAGSNAATLEWLRAQALKEPPGGAGAGAGATAAIAWLSGPCGSGKTHLLQACCAAALAAGRSALYLPLSQLAPFGPAVMEGWPRVALTALDELAAVVGQREWEQALFALYRDVEERGGTLLAADAVPPGRLVFALPDLASRFAAALPLSLAPLDEAGQRRALQWRARARGLDLPEATARYLQRRFRRDLPTLCSLLDTLDVAALQAQRRVTIPFIREVLGLRAPPST